MIRCDMCDSRAIFTDEKGRSKCVKCNPYKRKIDV